MLVTLSVFILAFAVSLDSFTVGFTYGLRKMQIPFKSLLIIAACTAVSLTLAMTIGHLIARVFSPKIAESVGGIMLVIIGMWIFYQTFRSKKEKNTLVQEKTIFNLEIKSLGLAIHILQRPMSADFDRSGTITGIEALFLGIALSLDAFGAGISAAMLGFSPLYLAVAVTTMSSLFVFLGIQGGRLFADYKWIKKLSFIPGIILVCIGIWKI